MQLYENDVGLTAIKDRTLALWRELGKKSTIENEIVNRKFWKQVRPMSETSDKHYHRARMLLVVASDIKSTSANNLLAKNARDKKVEQLLAEAQVEATLALVTKDW